jgi:hypothetical protein
MSWFQWGKKEEKPEPPPPSTEEKEVTKYVPRTDEEQQLPKASKKEPEGLKQIAKRQIELRKKLNEGGVDNNKATLVDVQWAYFTYIDRNYQVQKCRTTVRRGQFHNLWFDDLLIYYPESNPESNNEYAAIYMEHLRNGHRLLSQEDKENILETGYFDEKYLDRIVKYLETYHQMREGWKWREQIEIQNGGHNRAKSHKKYKKSKITKHSRSMSTRRKYRSRKFKNRK